MTTRQSVLRRAAWRPLLDRDAELPASADGPGRKPTFWMLSSRPGLLVLQWIGIRRGSDHVTAAMPHAQGLDGPHAGKRLSLDADLVFGRDPKSCNVVFSLDDDGISARHCSLRFLPSKNAFELRDLGSANGTFVGGRRVDPGRAVRLRDGDEFHLFRNRYRFAVRLGAS